MQTNRRQKYDYVIAGAGCAGLSLLMRILSHPLLTTKKVLLIERSLKNRNDRTWCFWEKNNGFFEDIVYKKWKKLEFLSDSFSTSMDISPYEYKMIRGIDLYEYCFEKIHGHPNVDIMYGDVKHIAQNEKCTLIQVDGHSMEFAPTTVFNSIYMPSKENKQNIHLWQHFKGWIIETERPFFNASAGTLMDFRVGQQHGNTFAYLLPFDERTGLVEYTLLTKDLLRPHQYDEGLKHYIESTLQLQEYRILDEEWGKIPMTTEKFSFYRNGIFYIGTAGGQTKASTGYTFNFIQRQAEAIIECLVQNKPLTCLSNSRRRFKFYDHVLLEVLHNNTVNASRLFADLFRKNQPAGVLSFLDNEQDLANELKIISSLPAWPFLKAGFKNIWR